MVLFIKDCKNKSRREIAIIFCFSTYAGSDKTYPIERVCVARLGFHISPRFERHKAYTSTESLVAGGQKLFEDNLVSLQIVFDLRRIHGARALTRGSRERDDRQIDNRAGYIVAHVRRDCGWHERAVVDQPRRAPLAEPPRSTSMFIY